MGYETNIMLNLFQTSSRIYFGNLTLKYFRST